MELTLKRKVTRATLNILFFITVLLAAVVLIASQIGFYQGGQGQESGNRIFSYNDDWSYQVGVSNRRVSLPAEVQLTSEGSLIFRNRLPQQIALGDTLCIRTNHQSLTVSVGGEEIYFYEPKGLIGTYYGVSYQFVPLTPDMAGKEIALFFRTDEGRSSTQIEEIFIGDEGEIVTALLRRHSLTIVGGAFFLMLGICLIGAAIVSRIRKKEGLSVGTMAAFLLLTAIWLLCDAGVLQLVILNENLLYLLEYTAGMLMLVPLLIYYSEILNFRHAGLQLLCELSLMNFIVQLIIYIWGAADFADMSPITSVLSVLCSFYLVGVLVLEYRRYNRSEVFAGMLAGILFAAINIMFYGLGLLAPAFDTQVYYHGGMLLFMLILTVDLLLKALQRSQEEKEQQISSQLSLLDGLTRMANRASYNRRIEQLASEEGKAERVSMICIHLDLSELLAVNEEFGYNAGDEIVLGCAGCVSRTFRNIGNCYRTLGNEFIVVMTEKQDAEIQAAISTFQRNLQDFNEAHVHQLNVKWAYETLEGGEMTKDALRAVAQTAAEKLK